MRVVDKDNESLGAASGTSPLAKDNARRLACDCSVSAIINDKGEPVDFNQSLYPKLCEFTVCRLSGLARKMCKRLECK